MSGRLNTQFQTCLLIAPCGSMLLLLRADVEENSMRILCVLLGISARLLSSVSAFVGDSRAVRRKAVSMSLFLFLCRVPYEPTPHPEWIKEACEHAQQAGANMPADLIWWNVKSAPPAYRRFLRAACRAARAEANEAIARVREAGQCRNMKRQKVSEAAK